VTRKSHRLTDRLNCKTLTSAGKRQPNLMGRRQNFMGQKAPSRPDTVIGSKKADVQIFDFCRYW
jgi:hypothetical protein